MKVCKSVRGAVKFDRLAPIPKLGARTIVWVDDIAVTKGECKHAVTDGSLAEEGSLKWALSFIEKQACLTSTEDVALFDGTGVVCKNLAEASDAV